MPCCSSLRKPPVKQVPNHWWALGVNAETPLHLATQSKPSQNQRCILQSQQDKTWPTWPRYSADYAKPISFQSTDKTRNITTVIRVHLKIDCPKAGKDWHVKPRASRTRRCLSLRVENQTSILLVFWNLDIVGWGGVGRGNNVHATLLPVLLWRVGRGHNVHATLLQVLFHSHTYVHATLLPVLLHFDTAGGVGKLTLPSLGPAHGSYIPEEQRVKKRSGRRLRFESISLKMGANFFEKKRWCNQMQQSTKIMVLVGRNKRWKKSPIGTCVR